MPAPVEVVNKALSLISARADVQSFEEVSPQAKAAALWFDDVRDQVLAAAHWGFSRRQVNLALRTEAPQRPWAYEYSLPEDCILVRYLGDGSRLVPFGLGGSAEGPTLLSDEPAAFATYTRREDNLGFWNQPALEALKFALAGTLAPALTGDMQKYRIFLQQANAVLLDARTREANQEPMVIGDWTPDWLAVRGVESGGSITNMAPVTYGPLFAISAHAYVSN